MKALSLLEILCSIPENQRRLYPVPPDAGQFVLFVVAVNRKNVFLETLPQRSELLREIVRMEQIVKLHRQRDFSRDHPDQRMTDQHTVFEIIQKAFSAIAHTVLQRRDAFCPPTHSITSVKAEHHNIRRPVDIG